MKYAITVEGISKRYIKGAGPKYDTFRDQLGALFKRTPTNLSSVRSSSADPVFWALRDVSFKVKQGQVLGIIGRNGAGKSTLLKILSRITRPTEGRAEIRGRVGSLLEVGTGFHPELTGRENVFLNGAILGMRRAEVQRKFDEIVEFSGVEEFLDTPVKRYSSGMITRLAFSVAAHLEPEVLIVDEVLSVGDSFFRKKCMGKMQDVAGEGRTVLFVSHNLNAIRSLCNRAIHLKDGVLFEDSLDVNSVVASYLNEQNGSGGQYWKNDPTNTVQNSYIRPLLFAARDIDSNVIERSIASDEDVSIQIELDVLREHPDLTVGYSVSNEMGEILYWTYTKDSVDNGVLLKSGKVVLKSSIPKNILNDGQYTLTFIAGIVDEQALFTLTESPIRFSLEVSGNKNRSSLWQNRRQSSIAPIIEWDVQYATV